MMLFVLLKRKKLMIVAIKSQAYVPPLAGIWLGTISWQNL
jgi:hypothetical protein